MAHFVLRGIGESHVGLRMAQLRSPGSPLTPYHVVHTSVEECRERGDEAHFCLPQIASSLERVGHQKIKIIIIIIIR